MPQLPAVAAFNPDVKVSITGDMEGRISATRSNALWKVDLEDFVEHGTKVEAIGVEDGGSTIVSSGID